MNDPCPDSECLVAYARGDFTDGRANRVADHLEHCPECEAHVCTLELGGGDRIIDHLRQPVSPDPVFHEPELRRAQQLALNVAERFAVQDMIEIAPAAVPSGPGRLRDYELLEVLGRGGMGTVYKALHTKLKRIVALKVLPQDRLRDTDSVARFEREMEAVGRLNHPNIVRPTDAGEVDGQHFLVMEFVAGCDLSALCKRLGPLSVADACELVRQAAVGLQHAHEQGLVHRDIKPSNLILSRDGQVKILDLGLALLDQADGNRRELTGTGHIMGTLDYMAPEQCGDSHEVDIRTDIYSLGATLFMLLTGEPPHGASNYDTPVKRLMALATESVREIGDLRGDLPSELAAVVHRMLEKDPDHRPTIPADVAEMLRPFTTSSDLCKLIESHETCKRSAEEPRSRSTYSHVSSALQDTTSHWEQPHTPASKAGTGTKQAYVTATNPTRTGHRWLGSVVGVCLGFAAVALAIVLTFQTKDGIIRVEIKDPAIEVGIKGTEITLKQADDGKNVKISAGDHTLVVRRGDFEFETDKLILKRGEEVTLRVELFAGEIQVRQGEKLIGRRRTLPPALRVALERAKKAQQGYADSQGLPVQREFDLPGGERLTFLLIPPGEFLMGSPEAEQERFTTQAKRGGDLYAAHQIATEGPQHPVRITRPFWLGKYEVTKSQWEAVMGNTPWELRVPSPVALVTWSEIQQFIERLNREYTEEGARFTMPTEAQWEYACRAGTTSAYYFGDSEDMLDEYGWFKDTFKPVGQLKPNGWGLYDMHGNAWEWCADWYGETYYAQSPVDDPNGPPTGSRRVYRGGGSGLPGNCRSATRYSGALSYRIGFRLAAIRLGSGEGPDDERSANGMPRTGVP